MAKDLDFTEENFIKLQMQNKRLQKDLREAERKIESRQRKIQTLTSMQKIHEVEISQLNEKISRLEKIKPSTTTKAKLLEEIEQLKAEKAALYQRTLSAEAEIETSRPYILLKRQYEELLEFVQKSNKIIEQPIPENPRRGRPSKITEKQRQQILELRSQGASIRTISREIGLSVGTVQTIVKSAPTV